MTTVGPSVRRIKDKRS